MRGESFIVTLPMHVVSALAEAAARLRMTPTQYVQFVVTNEVMTVLGNATASRGDSDSAESDGLFETADEVTS